MPAGRHNPAAWVVAAALAAKSGLDWAAWARGETNPIGVCPYCSREYPAIRTHTHCPPCFDGTAFEVDTKIRTKCVPVPAPWDADAYRADCARRGVEPGLLPSLSWGGDGVSWDVVTDGAFVRVGHSWVHVYIDGAVFHGASGESTTIDDLARVVTLATAAKRAMGT